MRVSTNAAAPARKNPMPPTNQQQTTAGDALAGALYAQLAGREDNIVVSPASVESCCSWAAW